MILLLSCTTREIWRINAEKWPTTRAKAIKMIEMTRLDIFFYFFFFIFPTYSDIDRLVQYDVQILPGTILNTAFSQLQTVFFFLNDYIIKLCRVFVWLRETIPCYTYRECWTLKENYSLPRSAIEMTKFFLSRDSRGKHNKINYSLT